MATLAKVEGIGPVYAKKLQAAGVKSTNDLLKKGAKPKGRKEIAKSTDISEKLVLEWVNHVDLFRIKGVGEEYADLIEEAGVDTVVELKNRNPNNLHKKMAAVNMEKKLVRQLPSNSQVSGWVAQAKKLRRAVHY